MSEPLALNHYRLLGRSGLRVSPLSLGTMTFGEVWGAGSEESRRLFDTYVDRGGNFIDTACMYAHGRSEELLGQFLEGKRDQLVVATKYSLTHDLGDPNAGGNSRKNMRRSVEASLRRLRTDYIDLFYLHVWDGMTPVEEVLRGLDDLVQAGKVTYVGISDTPAWQVARLQTMADLRGWSPLVALQIEYSLAQRTVERDLIPMAQEMGLGVLPWSPLASGLLSGKYSRADLTSAPASSEGRKQFVVQAGRLTEHVLSIGEMVQKVASEIGKTPAQVALAWLLTKPAVTSPILGARTLAQLQDNLDALSVTLDQTHLARLEQVSGIELGFPHDFLGSPMAQQWLTAGTTIRRR